MTGRKQKQTKNPYEKIFDDAHKRLADVKIDYLDKIPTPSNSKGFVAPFPYGRPTNQSNGWN